MKPSTRKKFIIKNQALLIDSLALSDSPPKVVFPEKDVTHRGEAKQRQKKIAYLLTVFVIFLSLIIAAIPSVRAAVAAYVQFDVGNKPVNVLIEIKLSGIESVEAIENEFFAQTYYTVNEIVILVTVSKSETMLTQGSDDAIIEFVIGDIPLGYASCFQDDDGLVACITADDKRIQVNVSSNDRSILEEILRNLYIR